MKSLKKIAAILIGSTVLIAATFKIQELVTRDGTIANQDFPASEVGKIISPQMGVRHHNQPVVFNGYAILTGNSVHEVWDISNPYAPQYKTHFTSDHSNGEAESHQVTMKRDQTGKYFMATISGRGFDIWDLTNTTSPAYIAAIQIPGVNYGDVDNGVWGLAWQGNYIYVGATNHGIFVVDVSNLQQPVIVKQVPLTDLGGVKAGPLFALGNILVVTTPKNHSGIATLDISNPGSPIVLDYVNNRSSESYIGGFYGKHAVLINPVRFYDVTTDPSNITLVGSNPTSNSEYVAFDGGKLFLGGLRGNAPGIHVYDLSDLDNIQEEVYIQGRDNRWDDQFACPVGNMVIISDDQNVDGGYVGSVIGVYKEKKDLAGPTVITSFPKAGATDVSVNSSIGISFSDWIEFKSVTKNNFIVRPLGGTPISGSWSWTYTSLSFSPDQPLQENTTYEVIIPTNGITDLVGNPVAQQQVIVFSTGRDLSVSYESPLIDFEKNLLLGNSDSWKITNPSDNVSYEWLLNGEVIGNGFEVSPVYSDIGRYQGCLRVYASSEGSETLIHQAEDAEFNTFSGEVSSFNTGYSGSGYFDFSANQGSEVSISWPIHSEQFMETNLRFQYANGGTAARPMNVFLDGVLLGILNFAPTGAWTTYNLETIDVVNIEPGLHTIRLEASAGSIGPNIDYLAIDILDTKTISKLESENGFAPIGAGEVSKEGTGFSGTGYFQFSDSLGSNIYLEMKTADFGEADAEVFIAYSNGSGAAKNMNLVLNNQYNLAVTLPATANWQSFEKLTVGSLTLAAGINTIRVVANAGDSGPYIDYVELKIGKGVRTQDRIFEAEQTLLPSGVTASSDNTGYTGTGYADYPASQGSDVKVTWNVENSRSLTTPLHFRYANGSTSNRPLRLFVNGMEKAVISFAPTGAWTTWNTFETASIPFNEGANTIELVASAGSVGPNIDHLQVQTKSASRGRLLETKCFTQNVYELSDGSPSASSGLIINEGSVWNVNPDANTVTVTDLFTQTKVKEIKVGGRPTSLVNAGTEIWVASRESWNISIINKTTKTITESVALPYGSQPLGILSDKSGDYVYVSLSTIGKIAKIERASRKIVQLVELTADADENAPRVGALAMNGTGNKLYVNRFISGQNYAEVYVLDLPVMQVTSVIPLNSSTTPDASNSSRGIPNYLTGIAINPNGREAWVASKKDNIERGSFRDGLPLDHQSTVRAIASRLDLMKEKDSLQARIDFDNTDRCHAVAFSKYGSLAFITLPGNHKIAVTDAVSGQIITQLETDLVPDWLAIHPDSALLAVHNFLSRSVTIYDISPIILGEGHPVLLKTVSVVTEEPLTPVVLQGKKIFYDASSKKLNQSGYMSCASCHLDGGQDGQVWDFTSLGEGFRNTIELNGRAGTAHGRLHWTANFNEIHDFENQLRAFGSGSGLMKDLDFALTEATLGEPKAGYSEDLDALSAYVESLDKVSPSPFRDQNGSLTAEGETGKNLFLQKSCNSCHQGAHFTDSPLSLLHDVGTINSSSGKRLTSFLTGFDTPTLKGVWGTAPYLHDGSAKTIEDAIIAHTKSVNPEEARLIAAYVKQIDESETGVVTGQAPKTKKTVISVYPNPAAQFIWINGVNIGDAIEIFDVKGLLLISVLAKNKTENIDVNSLKPGIYLVRVSGTETVSWIKR